MATQPAGILTLLTDFGLRDAYVAIMKGVVLGIAPHARLVDFTHDVAPQAIDEAAYLLHSGYRYFPAGTIHLVVVDPGVGSDRRPIAVATPRAFFVAPDNGVLTPVVEDARAEFGDRVETVELVEPRYWLPEVSATFHGRDIFAPCAAHLLNGVPLARLGRPIHDLVMRGPDSPGVGGDGALQGRIVHIDRFGNCITSITLDDLRESGMHERLVVEVAGRRLHGLYRTYSEAPSGVPFALLSSSRRLEVAVANGNAARLLGVTAGEPLRVLPAADR